MISEVRNMWYRAEFEDENFEMVLADNDNEAFEQAKEMEEEHGILFNVFLLDDDNNEIRTVF